ncbi:Uncharacterized protein apha_01215 [Umezakia ovalisporum]|nr:Uncharacterized protein apha_01215 [Umezakia ovalisporum]
MSWLLSTYFLIRYLQRYNFLTVGLPIVFILIYFLLNCGAFVYILPWYSIHNLYLVQSGHSFKVNELGFVQTTYFLVTFTLGCIFGGSWLRSSLSWLIKPNQRVVAPEFGDYRFYLYTGLVFYLMNMVLKLVNIPSVSSLLNQGLFLCATAICIGCLDAQILRDKNRYFYLLLFASTVLPVLSLVVQGFLSFATSALAYVWGFILVRQRLKWRHLLIFIAVFYLMLSVFVSYMQVRESLRSIIWAGGSYSSRIEATVNAFQKSMQLFDISNNGHLELLDTRLNLNIQVGQSIEYLNKKQTYGGGETLYTAFIAPIPRILWPEKPIIAGGSELVTRYTGRKFADGVSIGIGIVMEMYVNFSTMGVILGGYITGTILRLFDILASENLFRGRLPQALIWFMPGLSLIQPIDTIAFAVGTAATSFVLIKFLNYARILILPVSQSRSTS